MTAARRVGPPESEQELERFGEIAAESLHIAVDPAGWMERYDRGDFRLVRDAGGQVAGGLILLPCGQFFGGRRLPMVGIHAVAIAPEARGSGAGSDLLTATVNELAARAGTPLSCLYPATQPIYRSVGFEQAGTFTRYRLPVSELPRGSHALPLERLGGDPAASAALLAPLYLEVARRRSGFVDRTPWFWRRLMDPIGGDVTTFAVREAGRITGYASLSRRWRPEHGHLHSEIHCRQFLAATPAAQDRLWALCADERSLGRAFLWNGAPAPIEHITHREQRATIDSQLRWMLRLLDVEAALAGRGYPGGLSATLALEVDDPLVERNRGGFTVRVEGGRAEVQRSAASPPRPGAPPPIRLGAGALAALYTGYLPAEDLSRAGLAEGPPDSLSVATSVFAGPAPWLPEIF